MKTVVVQRKNMIALVMKEPVFCRNRHVVYFVLGVVMFNAAVRENVNTCSFCGGKYQF